MGVSEAGSSVGEVCKLMVYLYAGLGVLMLSGIMAIFEMGLSLTGQSMLPTP